MVDKESAKRAIKILNASIAIQDLASSKEVIGLDILYLTKERGDKTLERIIMRLQDDSWASVTGGEFAWDLTTLRSKSKKKKKLEEMQTQQLAS